MGPSNPLADWDRVGDEFYRKVRIYEGVFAGDDLELENYVIAAAPYGGAIAVYRDDKIPLKFKNNLSMKSTITLYSYSGRRLGHINWEHAVIRGVGWSEDERLLVVTKEGNVRCYSGLQGDFTPFSLGFTAEEYGVKECRFWSNGLVALLGNNQLIAVPGYDEPRPKLLAPTPSSDVWSWTLIPPTCSLSRSIEVLLAIDNTVYTVDPSETEDRFLQNGPFRHVSVSPNGQFVALYTAHGNVWVVSHDFQLKLGEHETKARTPPRDLVWCGNDCVILAWEDELLLLGPNGSSKRYFYDGRVRLVPEFDGVRLITHDACEFLYKIPSVTEDVFRVGSTSLATVLLDSVEQLEKKSPRADENIQRIRPLLTDAVDTCVQAAGQEYNTYWQKQLLKAASFGKSVIDLYSSDEFVEMTERLRVLNAVRDYKIGMPLSHEQYLRLTPEKLVERLINRHEYLLAIQISDYLALPSNKIYVHWACEKVRISQEDDAVVCDQVVKKLEGQKGISFEQIAQSAYDEGRGYLATQLLNHEPRSGIQVPLLLTMEEDMLALDKAMESGDTDLMRYVLLHLQRKLPMATFFRAINARPLASVLVETAARESDKHLLKDLYYQDDRAIDVANLHFKDAVDQSEVPEILLRIKQASAQFDDSRDPNVQFHKASLSEASQLLKTQEALEREMADNTDYVGLSINETIFQLVKSGFVKRAGKVQSEFKVPEKTFWWIRLRGLIAKRDWGAIEDLAKMKKSPIGWESFFNEVLSAGNSKLAALFVPKCTTLTVEERIEMWIKCGMIGRAAEEAQKVKDVPALERLRARTSTGHEVMEIDRMINQLRPGK